MAPYDFLKKIWPERGLYCIATKNPGSAGFRHRVFSDIGAAAQCAQSLDDAGLDAFFAVGTLRERRVWNAQLDRYQVRAKANMSAFRAFFVDIDVGDGDKKYATQNDALVAAKMFAKYVAWPKPTIVSSGYGLHIYWTLAQAISAEMFAQASHYIRHVAQQCNLNLDTAALDLSRVLRVVGTHNHKRDPARPVELLHVGEDTDPKALFRALRAIAQRDGATMPPAARWQVPDYLQTLDGGESNLRPPEHEEAEFTRIVAKCAALQQFQEAGGDVSYHYWLHSLQVIRLCKDGQQLAHELSSPAPTYTAEATDRILADLTAKDIGPTRCATFEIDNPEACAGCPLRGKLTSPIILGRQAPEKPAIGPMEIVVPSKPTPQQIMPPPAPYKRVAGEGVFVRATTKDNEEYDKKIHDYDMFPVMRVFNEREEREYVQWVVATPTDGHIELAIPAAALFDSREFTTALANSGVYLNPDKNIISEVRSYMVAYTQALQRQVAREQLFSRMGWRGDDAAPVFVVGQRMFDKGVEHAAQVDRGNAIGQQLRSSGSLDAWKAAVAALNHPSFLMHQFVLGTAFGAPLMRFTHQAGAILHLYGASGKGKSSMQRLVNSVWGHPTALMLPADPTSSTQNARMMFLSTMNTLPVCAEEITAIAPDDLTSLTYAINLGEEKYRATRTGDLRKRLGSWSTILLSSANASLHQKLLGTVGADATTLRIIEMHVPGSSHYSRALFEDLIEVPIRENYGVAGPEYAKRLTQLGQSELRTRVQQAMRAFEQMADLRTEERVWSALVGANLAGLQIAAEAGLISFNVSTLSTFAKMTIANLRTAVRNATDSPAALLAAYMNDNITHTLLLGDPVRIPGSKGAEPLVVREPTSRLEIRVELPTQRAFVAVNGFRTWLGRRGVIASQTFDELQQMGVALSLNAHRSLGVGTRYSTGPVRCLEVDLRHEAMAGVHTPGSDAATSNVTPLIIPSPQRRVS